MNVVLLWPAAGNRHGRWATSCTIVGLRTVILEKRGGKIQMLKARGKKLGWTTALGQAAFILASRILSWQARVRSAEIIRLHDLCTTPVAGVEIIEVPSVNVSSTIKILRRLNPMCVHQYARRDYTEISRRAWRILGALPWGQRVGVLYQERIDPGRRDNFCTYLLQLAAGIPVLVRSRGCMGNRLTEVEGVQPRINNHPRLLQYLVARIRRGVK